MRAAAAFLMSLVIGAQAACSQLLAGADVTLASPYVWRGLTRANGWSAHPEAYVAVRAAGGFVAAGQWWSYQLNRTGSQQLSALGPGGSGLAEINRWMQYGRRLGAVHATLGFVRYEYRGTNPLFGGTPAASTSEAYGTVRFISKYLTPGLAVYYDVDRLKGAYLEASAGVPVFSSPLRVPQFWIVVGGLAGYSLGEEVSVNTPVSVARFARSGITHLDFSATLGTPLAHGAEWQIEGHVQFNDDPFTWRTSANPAAFDRSILLFLRTGLKWAGRLLN